MKACTVYSVGRGLIKEYELIKETNCYYFIKNGEYKDRLSKDGYSLPQNRGGRSVVTKDVLVAATAAQQQINTIDEHLENERVHLCEANDSLEAFYTKHTLGE